MPALDSIFRNIDDEGKGLSKEDFTTNSKKRLNRKKLAILVIGQSNEQGVVTLSDKAAYPQAFQSQRNEGVYVPVSPDVAVANRGGWWPKVYDDLYDWGYDAQIINGAVGGMGMQLHCCGVSQDRVSSSFYYMRRDAGLLHPDRGDFGDIIAIPYTHSQLGAQIKIFNVTGNARKRSAFNAGPFRGVVGTSTLQDFVAFSQENLLSGSSVPSNATIEAAAVGQTITDGNLTLTCLELNQSGSRYDRLGTYNPDSLFCFGGMLGEQNAGFGFDPLGIIARGWEALSKSHAEKKLVYIQNGQTDLGVGNTSYSRALACVATFFLRRNCAVMIGNTLYSPGSANSTVANYTAQIQGVDSAISLMTPFFPGKVFRGANLFASMGSTGPMGGQRVTGSISGTTLTVTAVSSNQGSGVAVGQTVWNNQTAVGIITSQLTGTTGGVGTYQVSSPVATGSTTLICAGSWLQFDGIHINGAGAVGPNVSGISCAGKYVSDAIKAILPELT